MDPVVHSPDGMAPEQGAKEGASTVMLIAEASVETERPSRYLVQLCEHLSKVGRGHPEMPVRVEWTDDRGEIRFDWGRCTLRAQPSVLALRAEAADEDALRVIQDRVADRLERIGSREGLTVQWASPPGQAAPTAETPDGDSES